MGPMCSVDVISRMLPCLLLYPLHTHWSKTVWVDQKPAAHCYSLIKMTWLQSVWWDIGLVNMCEWISLLTQEQSLESVCSCCPSRNRCFSLFPSPMGNMPFPAYSILRSRPQVYRFCDSASFGCVCLCVCVYMRIGAAGLKHPRPAVWTQRHLSPSLAQPVPSTHHLWAWAFKASPNPPASHILPHIIFVAGKTTIKNFLWSQRHSIGPICVIYHSMTHWMNTFIHMSSTETQIYQCGKKLEHT